MANNEHPIETASHPSLWGFGILLSSSWKYYTALIPAIFLLLLIPIISSIVTAAARIGGVPLAVTGFLGLLDFLILLFFSAFFIPVVSILILDRLYEKKSALSPADFFPRVLPLIKPYAVTMFLSSFVTLGGYVLFIVPGVLIGIWLSLVLYVVVLEGRKGWEALLRSTGLVKGSSWEVFLRMLGLVFVMLFLNFLLVGAPGIFLAFQFFGSGFDPAILQDSFSKGELPPNVRIISEIGSVWQNFLQIILLPFWIAYLFLLYKNLKQIKGDVVAHEKKTFFMILAGVAGIGIILFLAFAAFLIAKMGESLGTI